MAEIDQNELEKISDYSIALIQEISRDIESLNKHIWRKGNNLDKINRKIDLARWNWVNVDSLDKQVQEFRVSLFKRQIKHKLEDLKSWTWNFLNDVTKIRWEYEELQKEKWIDLVLLEKLMKELSNELTRSLIKHMITNIGQEWGTSLHSMDKIAEELEKAKEKWIRVDDIEEMLFGG